MYPLFTHVSDLVRRSSVVRAHWYFIIWLAEGEHAIVVRWISTCSMMNRTTVFRQNQWSTNTITKPLIFWERIHKCCHSMYSTNRDHRHVCSSAGQVSTSCQTRSDIRHMYKWVRFSVVNVIRVLSCKHLKPFRRWISYNWNWVSLVC
jgi:hypothetical protein